MKNKLLLKQLNIVKECRQLGLPLWQCPSFLFVLMGSGTIFLMLAAYFVAITYYNLNIVLSIINVGSAFMLVIMFFVERGMTKVIEAEKNLERSHEELKYSFLKLKEFEEVREEFTSTLVHDLRSPLTGIRLLSELLQNKSNKKLEPEMIRESIDMINYNTVSMLNMINNILDIAKIKVKKFKIFKESGDIREVIKRVYSFFKPIAFEKEIKIEIKIDPKIQNFNFDIKKVEQVIINLLTNALNFTGNEGKVIIYVLNHQNDKSIADEAGQAKIDWDINDHLNKLKNLPNSVMMAVSDTGVGIPQEYIDNMFEEVRRIRVARKPTKGGNGISLIICKGIVEAHGGVFGVKSQLNKGSTFYFNLPV